MGGVEASSGRDFGRFVSIRRRGDGTYRVLFDVPKRIRPAEWPATIPLPVQGARTGVLSDASEVARIKADARRLNECLDGLRSGVAQTQAPRPEARSLQEAIELWQDSPRYRRLSTARHRRYGYSVEHIRQWSREIGDPHVDSITEVDVEAFLERFDDRPSLGVDVRTALNRIFIRARDARWTANNPVHEVKVKPGLARVEIWDERDVMFWADTCVAEGEIGLAALIVTQFWHGQRLGDVRRFRHGVELVDGYMCFNQSKTGTLIRCPIAPEAREWMARARRPGTDYAFTRARTGLPFTEPNLATTFQAIRNPRLKTGDRLLTLQNLRHSCVVQLVKQGNTVPQIGEITGHAWATIHHVMQHYYSRDPVLAFDVMQRRVQASGGDVAALPSKAIAERLRMEGDPRRRRLYVEPPAPRFASPEAMRKLAEHLYTPMDELIAIVQADSGTAPSKGLPSVDADQPIKRRRVRRRSDELTATG